MRQMRITAYSLAPRLIPGMWRFRKQSPGSAQDPRLHYGVKLHFGNLDVDLDNSEHVQRARRPLLGKHELLTRCIFSGDGGELHGLKPSSIDF